MFIEDIFSQSLFDPDGFVLPSFNILIYKHLNVSGFY